MLFFLFLCLDSSSSPHLPIHKSVMRSYEGRLLIYSINIAASFGRIPVFTFFEKLFWTMEKRDFLEGIVGGFV